MEMTKEEAERIVKALIYELQCLEDESCDFRDVLEELVGSSTDAISALYILLPHLEEKE